MTIHVKLDMDCRRLNETDEMRDLADAAGVLFPFPHPLHACGSKKRFCLL